MMKKLALALAAGAVACAAPVQAQNVQGLGILALDPVDDGNTVLTLKGESTVVRQADVAVISSGVTTVGKTAEEALRTNASTMTAILAAAKQLGVADKDIQTNTVSVSPIMSNDREGRAISQSYASAAEEAAMEAAEAVMAVAEAIEEDETTPRIVGYRATNAVSLRQRKLVDFGKTIDRLVAAGSNEVSGPVFGLEDSNTSEEEARVAAIADARQRANRYAAAADMRVVRIVMMDEGRISGLSSRNNSFGFMEARPAAMFSSYSETPVMSGELSIKASVGMLFELAPR